MTNHHFRVCAYRSYISSRTCSYAIASPTDEVSFKAALHESPERTLAPRSACKPWHMCTLNPATFQPPARCGCTPRRADARVLSLHLEGDAGARRGLIFFFHITSAQFEKTFREIELRLTYAREHITTNAPSPAADERVSYLYGRVNGSEPENNILPNTGLAHSLILETP